MTSGRRSHRRTRKRRRAINKSDLFDDTAEVARKGYHLAKKIARLVNVEIKNHDIDQTGTFTVPNTGIVHDLTVIAQGDSKGTRDGSSIKPLRVSGRLSINSSGSATFTKLRMILVRGKQENGVIPTISTYFETVDPLSPKNHNNRFQSKTLFDKTFIFNSVDKKTGYMDINETLFGHVHYTDATTAIEDGGLYLIMLSDQATNVPSLGYYIRVSYTDN